MSNSVEQSAHTDFRLGWTLVITGLGAWIASLVLVHERIQIWLNPNFIASCDLNPWLSCGAVMKSWQAALFGFPNPFIGLVGFALVITIGMGLLAKARFARWFWISLQVGLGACLIMLGWLYSQALFEIQALCLYCMIVWFFALPMFFYTLRRNILAGDIPAPARMRRFFENWTFYLVAALEIIVFGVVFFLFPDAFIPA